MTPCPKCGKPNEPNARICPGCGVILSKVRAKTGDATMSPGAVSPRPGRPLPSLLLPPPTRGAGQASPAPAPPPFTTRHQPHTSPVQALMKVVLAAAAGIGAIVVIARMQASPAPDAVSSPPPTRIAATRPPPPIEPVSEESSPSLSQEDIAFLNELTGRLSKNVAVMPTDEELQRVEKIQTANRDNDALKTLLMGVYMRLASRDLQAGSYAPLDLLLGKMKALDDQRPEIYALETEIRARQNDWAGAMAAIQKYEGTSGEASVSMSYMLALSLEKLGRRPDALAVLDRPIFASCPTATAAADVSSCDAARLMREAFAAAAAAPAGPAERTRAAMNIDASKDQIQSERFDIRFDGESQQGVARDVLFVLDRAYTRLADVYYDRPARKIPVVLHSGDDYYTKTGAPWWSGGVYDSHDGGIQIPVRGMPSSLPREMEDVLVHELSHAFVDEMSGGFVGKDLQEGLAQYMEGKRIEKELPLSELKRLANSNGRGVMPFYMLSLAVTQQLIQSRGQGQINLLLKAMKETGSEDGAFRKVFGQSSLDVKKEIIETFWRRYS